MGVLSWIPHARGALTGMRLDHLKERMAHRHEPGSQSGPAKKGIGEGKRRRIRARLTNNSTNAGSSLRIAALPLAR